ncbi:hypothetical protein VP01_2943g2 [Puccinia sorghi]|uniref:Uncharacterized protein n=1 Tax=Puccinia sorghi TaxID=27349 RepID=A0A0L6V117_9BASI|nr:hypothetical protein VP01_2943g2 [Puccinia sorghi]
MPSHPPSPATLPHVTKLPFSLAEIHGVNKQQAGLPNNSTICHQVKFSPHNLYPMIPWEDKKPTCRTTPTEVEKSYDQIQLYHSHYQIYSLRQTHCF